MAEYSSVFKMRDKYNKMTSYKGTISNTLENKVENWFKERKINHASRVHVAPIAPIAPITPTQLKNTIDTTLETTTQVIKPPGLQKYPFSESEIHDILLIPQYEDFYYIDMVSKKDCISDFLMLPLDYSTPLFSE
jgi:hypothetical protein